MSRKIRVIALVFALFGLPVLGVACAETPTAVRQEVPPRKVDCTVLPPPDTSGCTIEGGTLGSGNRYCC